MSDSKEKKLDYVVVKQGVAEHKVGDTIKLTERTAASLANKVVLKSEYNQAPKSAGDADEVKALKKENAELKKQVAALETAMGGGEG